MKIIVPQEITSKIHNAVMESSPNEIKGALFAERLFDECFQIDDVYISQKCGTHIFSNLVNNVTYKRFEKRYFKKHKYDYLNHNYIGDWHSHPLFECVPSNYDNNEIKDELAKSNALFLIQLIVKDENGKLTGRCYFCNKNSELAECELIIHY